MRNTLALCALALALASPAFAQSTPRPVPRQDPPQGTSHLPIDAMLHHQPRGGDVARREAEQPGSTDEDLRRRRAELDALYNDVMARSAPQK